MINADDPFIAIYEDCAVRMAEEVSRYISLGYIPHGQLTVVVNEIRTTGVNLTKIHTYRYIQPMIQKGII